jgi:type III restriction enzyme
MPIRFDCRWLLAAGCFYPDFVAKLKDGRTFVVEYKGEHLASVGKDDTNEKRLVGALWEKASAGKGLFAMMRRISADAVHDSN